MKKLFIIDASGYLFSSYYAIRNMTNSKGESTNALFGFIRSLLKLSKDFEPTHMVAVFDGPRNAKKREEIYPEYKAHRKETPQDLLYQIDWAREFCTMIGIPYLNIPEVEADDTMGSAAVWAEKEGAHVFVCTSDKDMCQIVNPHISILNTRKDNLIITPKEVEEIHGVPPSRIIDLLAMTGDASDNVPGIPGIGPKTASGMIQEFGSLDNLLKHPEKIKAEKKRQLIIDNTDNARLSQKLVTIDLHVPIPLSDDFYRLKAPETEKLKDFYSKMNFHSLLKELEHSSGSTEKAVEEANVEYLLVDDEKSLDALIDYLKTQKEICFDTETSSIYPIRAELAGIGFSVEPRKAWYVPANGKLGLTYILEKLKPLFENPSIGFYGHNVKYDYHVLKNYNIDVATLCFDTILASYLLNSHNRQHNLDYLSLEYFGKVKIPTSDLLGKGKKQITMLEVPIDKVCAYCCEDVDYTVQLKQLLQPQLKERHLADLLNKIELPLIKVLARMERHGIYLDAPVLKDSEKEVIKALKKLESEIFALAGEEFNLNSPKQLSEILQNKLQIPLPKKTATGFSTNAEILEDLKENYPIAGLILDYRMLEKLRSTYIESLPLDINPKTDRIHCNFNQYVAATGRLSCQDPNLQNIPVRTEEGRKIREAFRPEKTGWSYLSADYSQIELRLLAHMSEDPILIDAFKHNADIHRSTAAAIFNVPYDAVTPEQRHQAKAVNFGIIYGQQAFGLSKELKIDVKSAASIIETYFKQHQKVKEFIDACKENARKTGHATTLFGRERLIPEINSKNGQLRAMAERLAVNTPLQGTQADLIKLAMLKIDEDISKNHLKGYMILQIHDELIFEVPDTEIETFKTLVKEKMQGIYSLKVPLIVDINLGKNWKEC